MRSLVTVLEAGQVVQQGSHGALLMQPGGAYARLVDEHQHKET